MSSYTDFEGDTLRRTIRATFDRRKTALPADGPVGLSDRFVQDAQKQTQWQAFLGKNKIEALSLEGVVATLREFLLPFIMVANVDTQHSRNWQAAGPWLTVAR